MTITVHPTISNTIRIDIDSSEHATRLADFIEASNPDMRVTQVTMHREMGQAYLLVRARKLKEPEAMAELEVIVNEFKKDKK